MNENIYQPSLSTSSESLSEIAGPAKGIREVNIAANGDGVISRQKERDSRGEIRELNRRRRFHHRWVKDGRDRGVTLTDLHALRRNIGAGTETKLCTSNRVSRNSGSNGCSAGNGQVHLPIFRPCRSMRREGAR